MKTAFIGLGHMGRPMALNLLRANVDIIGFDISAEARQQSAAEGLALADTIAHAVAEADVVISMLPAGEHVEHLYLGPSGVLSTLARGALVIDCSTIAAASALRVAEAAVKHGIGCIDAPVSGGTAGAAAGSASPSSTAALCTVITEFLPDGFMHHPPLACGRLRAAAPLWSICVQACIPLLERAPSRTLDAGVRISPIAPITNPDPGSGTAAIIGGRNDRALRSG